MVEWDYWPWMNRAIDPSGLRIIVRTSTDQVKGLSIILSQESDIGIKFKSWGRKREQKTARLKLRKYAQEEMSWQWGTQKKWSTETDQTKRENRQNHAMCMMSFFPLFISKLNTLKIELVAICVPRQRSCLFDWDTWTNPLLQQSNNKAKQILSIWMNNVMSWAHLVSIQDLDWNENCTTLKCISL